MDEGVPQGRRRRPAASSHGKIELLRSAFARLRLQRREGRPDQPHAPAQRERVAQQLSQLMVPRDGIEPPTLRFSVACSTN